MQFLLKSACWNKLIEKEFSYVYKTQLGKVTVVKFIFDSFYFYPIFDNLKMTHQCNGPQGTSNKP